MSSPLMKKLILTLGSASLLLAGSVSLAQTSSSSSLNKRVSVEQDLDTLGGNEALLQKAKSIDAQNKAYIVQKRVVDRNDRLELGINYGGVFGGDSYLRTQNIGGSADFHITPHWSLGLRYYNYGNDLTPEGQRAFSDASAAYAAGGRSYIIPDIDYPVQSAMAVINWYPIYGKINLFERSVVQFDMYFIAGAGQIQLSSGWTNLYTGGAGMAFWLTQHISARTEIRYQNYHDQIITGPRNINDVVGTVGFGVLL